jgi:hypothetical protein
VKYSLYYQAILDRQKTWLVAGALRSHEGLCFDRALDKHTNLFEFFVSPLAEQEFIDFKKPVFYEWDVVCNVDGQKKTFWVHLSLKKFQKSSWGESAYELLYWVTNSEAENKHRHSSTSLWIHNSEKENQMRRLVSSLGIQEDDAYLRLTFEP